MDLDAEYAQLVDDLTRRGVRLVEKQHIWHQRLIDWALRIVTFGAQSQYLDRYVTTIGGRTRALGDIASAAWQLRFSAERQAVSTVVQGSAADIVRRAMLAARSAVAPSTARICLQVHDEILWKRGPRFTDATLAKLRTVCETGTGYALDVPLKFELAMAESWADKA